MEINKTLEREAAKISKEHSGMIAFPTIGLALLVSCLFMFVLFVFASGYLSPLISTLLLGFLTFASYTPMHEAVHGNVGGSNPKYKWLDSAVGLLMSPLISIPFNSHRKEHFAHHKHTNSEEDPDVHIQNIFRSLKDFYRSTLRVIKTQNTFVVDNFTRIEIAVSIGWRLLFVLGTGIISIPVLFFGWFSGAFLTIYLFSALSPFLSVSFTSISDTIAPLYIRFPKYTAKLLPTTYDTYSAIYPNIRFYLNISNFLYSH